MSITLFYLHSARRHEKNTSFTVHTVTRIEHETFAKWLQPCATHSSGIVQPLVGIVTSGPQVCSSLPPKIRKPKQNIPTISITSDTIISNKKWFSACKVRFIQRLSINFLQSGPCPPSPVAISLPPLLSCSYSSSQLEPRRDCSISANRAASRNFSVDRSTHLLWKQKSYNFKRSDSTKIKHIPHTKNKHFKNISHAFFKSSSSCFSRAVLAACRRSNLYKSKAYHTIMASLIYVHHAGNLGMPHAKKKLKLCSLLRLQRCIQVLHFFICLNQTKRFTFSQCRSPCFTYILLESIRKMSFTVHTVTRIEHETFAKWLQPCATHSSGIIQPLVGIVTSGPQVCSSLPPKIRKPKKKGSNHFNHIRYHHFK